MVTTYLKEVIFLMTWSCLLFLKTVTDEGNIPIGNDLFDDLKLSSASENSDCKGSQVVYCIDHVPSSYVIITSYLTRFILLRQNKTEVRRGKMSFPESELILSLRLRNCRNYVKPDIMSSSLDANFFRGN